MRNISSPLDPEEKVFHIASFNSKEIIEAWKTNYGVDVAKELDGIENLNLYQGSSSGLQFFLPSNAAGSDELYEALSEYDWYYMPNKWEHDIAIQDLSNCQKVIEIGCGLGTFVERLRKEHFVDAMGIELNSQAVEKCKKLGIPVFQQNVSEIANNRNSQFDAVCTFQVLEHVSAPISFLSELVKLLKPGGKLILSVPNQESFIQHDMHDFLNMPPHHMTRWSLSTFQYLENLLPIKLQRYVYEPLADYHVHWYLSVQCSRFHKYSPRGFFYRINKRYMLSNIQKTKLLRRFVTGHTLYVTFKKNESYSN